MIEKTLLNKGIINLKEISEKLAEDVTKNAVRRVIGNGVGSGFFCKIYINNNIIMPALITCYHVLNEDYIKIKKITFFFF